jgi:hypothetical protein
VVVVITVQVCVPTVVTVTPLVVCGGGCTDASSCSGVCGEACRFPADPDSTSTVDCGSPKTRYRLCMCSLIMSGVIIISESPRTHINKCAYPPYHLICNLIYLAGVNYVLTRICFDLFYLFQYEVRRTPRPLAKAGLVGELQHPGASTPLVQSSSRDLRQGRVRGPISRRMTLPLGIGLQLLTRTLMRTRGDGTSSSHLVADPGWRTRTIQLCPPVQFCRRGASSGRSSDCLNTPSGLCLFRMGLNVTCALNSFGLFVTGCQSGEGIYPGLLIWVLGI